MTEILITVVIIVDDKGENHQLSYYRLEDYSGYGVCIKNQEGAMAMVPGITTSRRRINALLNLLIKGGVSPAGMRDVVEDWLAIG